MPVEVATTYREPQGATHTEPGPARAFIGGTPILGAELVDTDGAIIVDLDDAVITDRGAVVVVAATYRESQ